MSRMSIRKLSLPLVAALWGVAAVACGAEHDVTLGDCPRLAGETDDTARLQRAIDATGDLGVLFIPKGEYAISRTIQVTNGASLLLHKGATVRAVAKMDYLFNVDLSHAGCWAWGGTLKEGHPYDQGVFFRGGHLDGNGLASCLRLNRFFHFTMRDVIFVNGFPRGLHVGGSGCELVADNLYFRTLKSGLAGNVALFTEGSDSYYSNIVVVDYTTGLRVRGGSNAFIHCHVWGGAVPPKKPGGVPEMLENSVCFDLGGGMNVLRDCYADTGVIGYKVYGASQQIVGSWFLNNVNFGLKDILAVKQDAGSENLLVADCSFRGSGKGSRVYEGPGNVRWRDMVYEGFPEDVERPCEMVAGRVCDCRTADEWEYLDGVLKYASAPGEFAKPKSARPIEFSLSQKLLHRKFPKAGAGEAFVFQIRATDPATKKVEFSVSQNYDRIWGKTIAVGREWREVRIPFSELEYFLGWGAKPLTPGVVPDARKMIVGRFMLGNWLCSDTADRAHGFEVSTFRIVGR